MIIAQELITTAVIETLRSALAQPIGDHDAPTNDDGFAQDVPYAVVYCEPGGDVDGPQVVAPEDDVAVVHRVTSVGESRRQAQWMADQVRAVLTGRDTTGQLLTDMQTDESFVVIDRRTYGSLGGVMREGTMYNVPDFFIICATPS